VTAGASTSVPARPKSRPSSRSGDAVDRVAAEMRVYLLLEGLQPQFAAYMATPTRARGYPPRAGDHSLIVEVAPALAIQRILGVALAAEPEVEPGLLYVERQYGLLEVHSSDGAAVHRAGHAILEAVGAKPEDQLKPHVLYSDIIHDLDDQHAVILNRTRDASMVLPGTSLLIVEVAPALFAAVSANSAERAAPGITLVDVQMIGATGRLFVAGDRASVTAARDAILSTLEAVKGR